MLKAQYSNLKAADGCFAEEMMAVRRLKKETFESGESSERNRFELPTSSRRDDQGSGEIGIAYSVKDSEIL